MRGVRRVIAFNWPYYAIALIVVAAGVAAFAVLDSPWRWAVCAAVAFPAWMIVASLLSSWLAYDRSALTRGEWLSHAVPATPTRVLVIHAGLDLASDLALARWPSAQLRVFDIFNDKDMSEPSIKRARSIEAHPGEAASSSRLPCPDAQFDAILCILAAHEIRDPEKLASFAGECRRALAPSGRLVVIEHLRDAANFLTFGPGFFHFLPRTALMDGFISGRLSQVAEFRLNPWMRVFVLTPLTDS
jgi:SAM-dependent methyltransferase